MLKNATEETSRDGRIRTGSELNPQRPEGYYGSTTEGYTDYPTINEIATAQSEMQYAGL